MELKQYWHIVWKWKLLIILSALLAGGVAFLVNRGTTPVYQVATTLMVSPGSVQSSDSYSSLIASELLAQTYAQLLVSEPLRLKTYERLGMGEAAAGAEERSGLLLPGALAKIASAVGLVLPQEQVGDQPPDFGFSAQPVRDTQLVRLRVEGTDPVLITEAANILVQVFAEWQKAVQQERYAESKGNLLIGFQRVQADIEETESAIREAEAQGQSVDRDKLGRMQDQLAQYRNNYAALLNSYSAIDLAQADSGATVTVVSPATLPRSPIRPSVLRNTLMAAVVGGMLGLGAAFFIEYLDDTVKTFEDLQASGLSFLAAVQETRPEPKPGPDSLLAKTQPRSLVSESYRTMRTNLQFSSLDRPLRSLVVTSAMASEGKSTTAANLAVVLAQDGKRVILVDADLRRPRVHRFFGLSNRTGLTTALVDEQGALDDHLDETGVENLVALTVGPVPPNPQEVLGSERMVDLIYRLQEEADIVILDTPPCLPVADANLLASRTDGVMLIVQVGETKQVGLQRAAEGLRQVGANVVGVVLNRVPVHNRRGYYYQYHYQYYDQSYHDEALAGGGDGRRRGWRARLGRRPKVAKGQAKPAGSQG